MLILYTVAPILYRMASSTYYNLSILSSDFYGLLFGLFLYVSYSDHDKIARANLGTMDSTTNHTSCTSLPSL